MAKKASDGETGSKKKLFGRFEGGTEPDARFSFANERTFLAWIRTALALIVAGLAVVTVLPRFHVAGGRRIIGLPLIALGSVLSFTAFARWQANERALRERKPLPQSSLPLVVSIGVGLAAVVALLVVVISQARG